MRTFDLPPFLIKFGKEKDIKRFVNEGSMRFGTYEEYRKQEEDALNINPGRTDELEGLAYHARGTAKYYHKESGITFESDNATFNSFQNKYTHLFCAYGATQHLTTDFKIDMKMKENFGDTAVLFNSKTFLQHISNLLTNTSYDMGYVNYFDESSFYKNLGPFSKRTEYSYQYEYRIATNLENSILNIGNFLLEQPDTHIVSSEELIQNIEFLTKE